MKFNRKLGKVIPITVTYYLPDENGEFERDEQGERVPTKILFKFWRIADSQAQDTERETVQELVKPAANAPTAEDKQAQAKAATVARLQQRMSAPPAGDLDDWPEAGTLQEQIAEYFTDDNALMLAGHALTLLSEATLPREFFRSV